MHTRYSTSTSVTVFALIWPGTILPNEDHSMGDIDEDSKIIATKYNAVHSTRNLQAGAIKLFPQSYKCWFSNLGAGLHSEQRLRE